MPKKKPKAAGKAMVNGKYQITESLNRRLKMAAADRGQTLTETIAEILDKALPTYAK